MRELRRSGIQSASCFIMLVCVMWVQVNRVQAQSDLAVTASFNSQTRLTPDTPIELHLSRSLQADEGRIGIVIGHTDVTSLFVAENLRLTYVPNLMPLPLEKTDLVVYQVGLNGVWGERARFPLQVVQEKLPPTATPALPDSGPSRSEKLIGNPAMVPTLSGATNPNIGTDAGMLPAPRDGISGAAETSSSNKQGPASAPRAAAVTQTATDEGKIKFKPSLTVSVKSQMVQSDFPVNTRPAKRATFTDETVQFSLRSEGSAGPLPTQTQFDFAGSSFQPEALRFGTLGNKAPQLDLASYLVQLQIGRAKVAIGHTSFGSSRQLVNSFSSRGITIVVPLTKRFDVSVAAMNGTNVVGYGNFIGLAKSKHQLQSATLGVELLPKRPGGLRLEFSAVTAYIQGLNSFTQGSVNDDERSKGGSVRLLFADKSGRFKFDGGFARSQYRNPADPLLYQGTNTIAVPFLTRNARYVDLSYDVLRGYVLSKTKQVSLSIAVRHEQVDPLFKSLGASTQSDKTQNEFAVTGNIGEISVQAGDTRFNDNLRRIPSILRSLTRARRFSIALPAIALIGGTTNNSPLLPRLSYSFDRTHQFGAAIPVNGGFANDPSLIPNQYNTNQTFSAEWQIKKLSAGYSYNRSFTDNQQLGRARSDFRNQTHITRVAFNPLATLNLNFDLTRESAGDLESAKLNRTWRVGSTATWNVNQHLVWTMGIANTIAGDRARTSDSRNTEFDTQFSWRVGIERGGLKKVQTQMFIRYADRYGRQQELLLGLTNLTRVKLLNGGLNITFF